MKIEIDESDFEVVKLYPEGDGESLQVFVIDGLMYATNCEASLKKEYGLLGSCVYVGIDVD